MKNSLLLDMEVDKKSGKIFITKTFSWPKARVWKAWTTPSLLDQWWAPRPYQNETIKMDFKSGGIWHYAMQGPTGDRHYCKAYYQHVEPESQFTYQDTFCDADGVDLDMIAPTHWQVQFIGDETQTQVVVELTYRSIEDMEKIIEMGFKEGFSMAIENLIELLETLK